MNKSLTLVTLAALLVLGRIEEVPAHAAELDKVKRVIAVKKAIAENPDSVGAHREYQDVMIEEGWKTQILEEYAGRLKKERTAENLYLLGRLQEGEEEAKTFETLVKEFPEFAWGYYGLGFMKDVEGDVDEAIRLTEKAVELDPQNALFYRKLSDYHKANGEIEKSLQTIEKGLRVLPDDPDLLSDHADRLYLLKRYDEARADLERALGQEPDHQSAQRQMLFLLTETKESKEAVAVGERYLSSWPNDRPCWAKLAQNHLALFDRRHDIESLLAAEKACEKAIQADPLDLDAYYLLIDYFSDRNWWVHALYYNNSAMKLTDPEAETYGSLEHNFEWIPAHKMGTSSFRIEAVEPSSLDSGASSPGREHVVQAIAAMREKDYRKARISLKKASELAPDDPLIQYHQILMKMFDEAVVGGTIEQLHQYRDAVKAGAGINLDTFEVFTEPFEGYLKRDLTSPEIHEAFGDIFDADPSGPYRKSALRYYEKAIELGGERARISEKINAIQSAGKK
ncbi:MAG: tetratricopeptide repeat protein [Candidatus Omnitrophica bacterium]|nr:tetratricopeptide repeat protein [Candidatus Omnitrophota bacterium]